MPAEAAIVAYLDTILSETAGTDLFEGPLPEVPINCIAVTNFDNSAALDRVMSGSLVNQQAVWPAHLQIAVRNTDKATAISRAKAAFDALDNFAGTLSGVTYHNIEAQGEPAFLKKDANESWVYIFDIVAEKQRG